jgi:hypothetical protein
MARRLNWSRTRWEGVYFEPIYEVTDESPESGKPTPKPRRHRETTFAERHQWCAETNWGIGRKKKRKVPSGRTRPSGIPNSRRGKPKGSA